MLAGLWRARGVCLVPVYRHALSYSWRRSVAVSTLDGRGPVWRVGEPAKKDPAWPCGMQTSLWPGRDYSLFPRTDRGSSRAHTCSCTLRCGAQGIPIPFPCFPLGRACSASRSHSLSRSQALAVGGVYDLRYILLQGNSMKRLLACHQLIRTRINPGSLSLISQGGEVGAWLSTVPGAVNNTEAMKRSWRDREGGKSRKGGKMAA